MTTFITSYCKDYCPRTVVRHASPRSVVRGLDRTATAAPRGGGPPRGSCARSLPPHQQPRPGLVRRALDVRRTVRPLPRFDNTPVGLGLLGCVVGEDIPIMPGVRCRRAAAGDAGQPLVS